MQEPVLSLCADSYPVIYVSCHCLHVFGLSLHGHTCPVIVRTYSYCRRMHVLVLSLHAHWMEQKWTCYSMCNVHDAWPVLQSEAAHFPSSFSSAYFVDSHSSTAAPAFPGATGNVKTGQNRQVYDKSLRILEAQH